MARTGRKRSAVLEVLAGRSRPQGSRADVYLRAAAEHAREEQRADVGVLERVGVWGTLYCHAREHPSRGAARLCVWCGNPMPDARADAYYDSDRCRQAARRERLR